MKSPPEAPTGPITVLIADDHPLVREGLAAIFKSQKEDKRLGSLSRGRKISRRCDEKRTNG